MTVQLEVAGTRRGRSEAETKPTKVIGDQGGVIEVAEIDMGNRGKLHGNMIGRSLIYSRRKNRQRISPCSAVQGSSSVSLRISLAMKGCLMEANFEVAEVKARTGPVRSTSI